MKNKALLITSSIIVIIIAIVLITYLNEPLGEIQIIANGTPCANLKGEYIESGVIAKTNSDGMLNWSNSKSDSKMILVNLKNKSGEAIFFGAILRPEKKTLIKIDTKRKTSETIKHNIYLNVGLFKIETEKKVVWQDLSKPKANKER